jgi:hypothetical protein
VDCAQTQHFTGPSSTPSSTPFVPSPSPSHPHLPLYPQPVFGLDAKPAHHATGVSWCKFLTNLLAQGKLKCVPVTVYPHGLESVQEGLQYMMDGKVSARKIVYRVGDTPGIA